MAWVILSCVLVVALLVTAGFALVQMGRASVAEDQLSYVLKQWEWDLVLDKIPAKVPQQESPGLDWDLSRSVDGCETIVEKDVYVGKLPAIERTYLPSKSVSSEE